LSSLLLLVFLLPIKGEATSPMCLPCSLPFGKFLQIISVRERGPVFSGLLLQGSLLVLGLPFILAGVLKASYDLTLWFIFRHVQPAEDEGRSTYVAEHAESPAHPPSQQAGASPEQGRRGNQ